MISTPLLAQLCIESYGDKALGNMDRVKDIVFAVSEIDNSTVVTFRGSDSLMDWVRDFEAVPVNHKLLGTVHAGFANGIDQVFEQIKKLSGTNLHLVGHSLGGAHARLIGGLFIATGYPLASVTTFGSPKPGYAYLSNMYMQSDVTHMSYRHANDIVPTMPPLPLWQHTEDYKEIGDAKTGFLSEFENHKMQSYFDAIM